MIGRVKNGNLKQREWREKHQNLVFIIGCKNKRAVCILHVRIRFSIFLGLFLPGILLKRPLESQYRPHSKSLSRNIVFGFLCIRRALHINAFFLIANMNRMFRSLEVCCNNNSGLTMISSDWKSFRRAGELEFWPQSVTDVCLIVVNWVSGFF